MIFNNTQKLLAGTLALVLVTGFGQGQIAWATPIAPGFDLFETIPITEVDLGPEIGIVQLEGVPIGPGNTDTIVERLQGIDPLDGRQDTSPAQGEASPPPFGGSWGYPCWIRRA